ncbi:MAG: hypothetical protein ACKV0T_02740 [Planctomycetales bacterium]
MPVLFDILTSVRGVIQGLNLPGLGAANVVIQKVPADRVQDLPAVPLPAVLIAPWGAELVEPLAGTNLRDDIIHPVRVMILAADDADQSFSLSQYLDWRERLRRTFHNQRLTTPPCFVIHVEPLPIVDRAAWSDRHLFVSSLLLRCHSREPRV